MAARAAVGSGQSLRRAGIVAGLSVVSTYIGLTYAVAGLGVYTTPIRMSSCRRGRRLLKLICSLFFQKSLLQRAGAIPPAATFDHGCLGPTDPSSVVLHLLDAAPGACSGRSFRLRREGGGETPAKGLSPSCQAAIGRSTLFNQYSRLRRSERLLRQSPHHPELSALSSEGSLECLLGDPRVALAASPRRPRR